MKSRCLLFLLFFMPMLLCAQSIIRKNNAPKKVLKLYDKAEKCFSKERYNDGIAKLEEAISLEPLFLDAYLQLGKVYYNQQNYSSSLDIFKQALEIDTSNAQILQFLAINHEKLENYDEAKAFYSLYLKKAKRLKPSYQKEIEKKISDYDFMTNAITNALPFNAEPLPESINSSQYAEYLPSLTADGNRLFFTRVTGNQEDIWYSEKDEDGTWKEAVMLPNLNTEQNEGAHSISADGKTILFTYCSQTSESMLYRGCNIYASFLRKDGWTSPEFFHAINSKAWDTQPNISADGRQVIFVSTRVGGQGESDLWWSRKNEEGKWVEPMNLGETINTPYREESPFFHPDGKTLFFKSEGHPGMGSFDLFMSTLQDDGTWTTPQNLGYPINTEDHEGAMIIALDGKTAYYSRGDGSVRYDSTQSDIYTFELPIGKRAEPVTFVQFKVYDEESKQPLVARVEVRNGETSVKDLITDNDGEILVILPLGDQYNINIDLENYYFHSERFELDSVNSDETAYEVTVGLRKIEEVVSEEPIILRNVLFATGSYDLKEESSYELDKLVQLLNDNVDLKIEIRGHTDDVGNDADNLLLSENRARSVYRFLVENGISSERLSYVGLGETMPISTNETEQGRKMNRRTEFITRN